MKPEAPDHPAPADAAERAARKALVCYPPETLPPVDLAHLRAHRATAKPTGQTIAPPRDAACVRVPQGSYFRITSTQGSQVGDLNLWNAHDLNERFYSGKTRALHGTHITTGERMWSSFPYLRPMSTVVVDTLGWYGIEPSASRSSAVADAPRIASAWSLWQPKTTWSKGWFACFSARASAAAI